VYAIDVGHGILDYRLRTDPRVVVVERTNARYLERLPEHVGFVSIDASFISLKLLLPVVKGWLSAAPFPSPGLLAGQTAESAGDLIALIKPQFEAGRRQVGKGGLVKDPAVHRQVLQDLLAWAQANGLGPAGLMRSPITGATGNVEFLAWMRPGSAVDFDSSAAIESALAEA
jgi:23S rRNA (cytidine1920-2'-O)/16S rRNA (cytidine1409-2'-O)-methyltransferase